MTYFGFLLRFLVIPIFFLLIILHWAKKNYPPAAKWINSRTVWTAIFIHILLAVIYTTPWDNYLVATGVWFYNPELITGVVFGYVPLEEYVFFVLETILAGLWWWLMSLKLTEPADSFVPNRSIRITASMAVAILWLFFTGQFFFGDKTCTYLSIIWFWALPAMIPQLIFGADILWHHRKLVVSSILVPAIYLSMMDMVALRDTTWSISRSQTTGILLFNILPIEEVSFFFITNTLVVFGMTLLISSSGRERYDFWKARWQK